MRFTASEPAPAAKAPRNFAAIRTVPEAQALANKLLTDKKLIGFDVETGYLGLPRAKGSLDISSLDQFVVGFSITNDQSWARYLPLHHDMEDNLPAKVIWEMFRPVLEGLPMVAHHRKFEEKNLRTLALKGDADAPIIPMAGHDTMLDAYVLSEWENPKQKGSSATGLKALTSMVLGEEQADLWSLFPMKQDSEGKWVTSLTAKQKAEVRFNVLPLRADVIAYACDDAALCLALHDAYNERAVRQRGLILNMELLISEIMAEVELFGVAMDWDGMVRAAVQYPKFRAGMEKTVKAGFAEMAGRSLHELNLGSPKQLRELLYDEIGLKTTRKTKGGLDSTDEIAMEALSQKYPAIRKLLELRQVENMGKRLEKWTTEFRTGHDDRVHANYSQTVVGTGRFAANDPPIQQCPKEWRWTTEGIEVWNDTAWEALTADAHNGVEFWTGNFRDFIVAAPGSYLLTFDYSQIELRVLAGVSGEQMLLDAFAAGQDVHTMTAAMMLGKRVEDIDRKTERPIGKTMNFALLYQMGTQSLSERLAISKTRADELYAEYFRQFSSVTTWMERAQREGLRNKYAETCFGRKWTIWGLYSSNRVMFAKGERVLINAPIQGGAADYMKLAMIRCRKVLRDADLWGKGVMITMNQHDSLTFEVDNKIDPNELRDLLEKAVVFDPKSMIRNFEYEFPKIVADWEIGQRWGSSVAWKPGLRAAWDGEQWSLFKPEETPCEEDSLPPSTFSVTELPSVSSLTTSAVSEDTSSLPTRTTARLPRASAADGQRTSEVIIVIDSMPDADQLMALISLLEGASGARPVTLRTPAGDVLLPVKTRLGIADRANISLAVGGAAVFEAADDDNLDALAASLTI